MDSDRHVPVLAGRVTDLLVPALAGEGAVLVDATLGRAGHARALLEACPGLLLVGVDADVAAIEAAGGRLAPYAARVTLVHARYDEIPAILAAAARDGAIEPDRVMGLLFDLGVSSPQLDDPGRGFAYAQDAPLDMRMDQTSGRTAADIVNGYPAAALARILRDYGEERFARRIADAVVRERARTPITSTQRLSAIVKEAIPRPPGAPGATRPSAPSRPCGSRSTTSSVRCGGHCPRRWTRSPSAAASWCSPTTHSRTASSSRSSYGGPRTRRRPACRSRRMPPHRGSACSPGAPNVPPAKKSPATRALTRPGSGPRSASGKKQHDQRGH